MPWQFFIGFSVICYSVSVLLQRHLLKESNSKPIAYAIVFQTIIAILIGIVGWMLGEWQIPDLRPLLPNLLLMTVLYGIANVSIFTALRTVEASKFTILFATRGLFTITASTLFLSESLSPVQIIGALLIFSSIIVVNIQANQLKFEKDDMLAIVAAAGFGLANTNDRALLMHMNVYVFSSIGFLLPSILMAMVYPREIKYVKMFLRPDLLKRMLVLCLFYAVSAVTFFMALQLSPNSSQVAAINLTSVILVVILAIIFLKEKSDLLKKLIGAGLAFLGLWLIR